MPLTKKEEERILKSHGFQWFLDLKKELAKKGKPLNDASLAEMEKFWNEAKTKEKKRLHR